MFIQHTTILRDTYLVSLTADSLAHSQASLRGLNPGVMLHTWTDEWTTATVERCQQYTSTHSWEISQSADLRTYQ